jgi:deazaflavin-dependent oxidoreductase (nitroreductase family)
MPSDRAWKALNAMHRGLATLTFGRKGWTASEMPVVQLTTSGRKTGQPRSVMLTSPVQEDSTWVVVASRGGDDRHPAWFLNLRDHPDVEVSVQGAPRQSMNARVASVAERARLWPQVTAVYPNYAAYQEKTNREIPLVLLEPRR